MLAALRGGMGGYPAWPRSSHGRERGGALDSGGGGASRRRQSLGQHPWSLLGPLDRTIQPPPLARHRDRPSVPLLAIVTTTVTLPELAGWSCTTRCGW